MIALKEELTEDTLVSNAHSDKLETHQTETKTLALLHQPVTETMPFNLLLILLHVVDAKTVLGQDKFQINWELLVSTDHSLSAMIALLDNQLIDTHAKNAQLDKFNQQLIHKHAIPHHVPPSTRSEWLLINTHAEDVKLANGQHTCQTHKELDALSDHKLSAIAAPLEDQMMDIHAKTAQLDKSKIQTILNNAMLQFAMDNMISDSQSTLKLVEDANHANGQDKFQTTRELLVWLDHLPNAQTALPEDLMINTHANNAQPDKSKTHLTWTDVSTLTVVDNTKFNLLMTQDHAEDARPVNGQTSCQINSRLPVLPDQRLSVVADKSNHQMDTPVLTAQLVPSKALPTKRFAWDHHVPDNTKSLLELMRSTVEDVILANGHNSCQTLPELNASKDH